MSTARLFHTVRHLKPVQVYGRVCARLRRPHVDTSEAPLIRGIAGIWAEAAARPISLLGRWRVRFLNEEGEIERPEQWNDPSKAKLWLYNLHYFDDLASPTVPHRRCLQRELVERWIAENPPGAGNGWEPYPVSLRIANWIKWAHAGEALEPQWCESLAVQVRWLEQHIEWHLLGNHILANAKALVLAGLFFTGPEAERWLERGLAIYARQLPEQILRDGAHFELSPMYHMVILEDLLDLLNAARIYKMAHRPGFAVLPRIIGQTRTWLAAMTHPDGGPSFFNDSVFGVAAQRSELEAYAARLGLPEVQTPGEGVHHLAASGYVRVKQGEMVAILDLAAVGSDYIPGHAHADTLSFELCLGAERVIVNGGTSSYAPGPLREAQRCTAAHSTVEVDGINSSEVWASFRVARRARVSDVEIAADGAQVVVSGRHDGYRRLAGRPTHCRTWRFADATLQVLDEITSRAVHCGVARFHLGPGIALEIDPSGTEGRLQTSSGRTIAWSTSSRATIEHGSWYPEFGKSVANVTLAIRFLSGRLTTTFGWL
jgi:uncharacterized heparinase superfamily protein